MDIREIQSYDLIKKIYSKCPQGSKFNEALVI